MSSRTVPEERVQCPVCGKGILEPQVRTERFDYGEADHKVAIVAENVPVEVCTHCHEGFSGPEAERVRHHAICRTLGLLTPEEIRTLRERLELSQADFAKLTGVGKATISRWERGWLLQNKAMDRYLRLLDVNPENLRVLRLIQEGKPVAADPPSSSTSTPRLVDGNRIAEMFPRMKTDDQLLDRAGRFDPFGAGRN